MPNLTPEPPVLKSIFICRTLTPNGHLLLLLFITDQIWSKKLDGLIKIQISEWQQHYNSLDKDGDGNGLIDIDEFAAGHQNIIGIIGDQFFHGKK